MPDGIKFEFRQYLNFLKINCNFALSIGKTQFFRSLSQVDILPIPDFNSHFLSNFGSEHFLINQ